VTVSLPLRRQLLHHALPQMKAARPRRSNYLQDAPSSGFTISPHAFSYIPNLDRDQ
jgi:hypothetical protein